MKKDDPAIKHKGKLIVVEGIDGSGKSTQINLLRRWLELEGMRVYFTSWNSANIVRSAIKRGKKNVLLTPTTFSLIHAIDFSDRYERQILPMLQAGYIVLADRYIYTAFARDLVRGCNPQWVKKMYSFAAAPDIAFFFKVDLETAVERITEGRANLKFFEAGMDLGLHPDPVGSFRIFQERILNRYISMESEYNFRVIDAKKTIEEQQQEVRRIVAESIDLPGFRLRI